MSDTESRFSVLRQSADPAAVAALEALVRDGSDPELNRINVIDFARERSLGTDKVLDTFLHAARLGMFDMSWNVLCPGCGGVLNANANLRTLDRSAYNCAICAAGYEPTLDESVEVSFTVNPRVRRIAAHQPHQMPMWDYVRQMYWASGINLPPQQEFETRMRDIVLDWLEVGPGEKATLSVHLPPGFIILFEPVTHSAVFFDVQGEPTRERHELGVVFNQLQSPTAKHTVRPGPVRITLENRTATRVLPALYVAGDELHHMLGQRKQFLTAKRLLTHQTFRDLFGTETLSVDQRLKITSLTFVFTDLKASTELYERVGDLAAYELVKAHFGVLGEAVSRESGAVVKTIGDAVMATFPSADKGVAAVLRMREAMQRLNESHGREDLLLKIGVHEGPCLAVTLNDRLDYFGQTVNIASRVQALADSASVFATEPIVAHELAGELISRAGLTATPRKCALRGIADDYTVYEIA
jgi:class 3 adenylate cyclase